MIYLKCQQKKVKIKVNNSKEELEKDNIKKGIEILKNGGVVIFPTDTVYGIGTLPEKKYVEKIYKIKKRDYSKKIIALISNKENLYKLIDETEENIDKISEIMNTYWPGDLTIIFKAKKDFVEKFDETMDTIGIRIPNNEIALNIIENVGGVVLTTSANLSGEEAPKKYENIKKEILEKVDISIKNNFENEKLLGIPSTIIKYENEKIELIREGNISFENIKKLMKG